MQIITQQGTTKAKASTMRSCAWVVIVEIVGYLGYLGFVHDSRVAVGEGREWLYLVMIEGGNVIPLPVLMVEYY